jgi:hypothetical protein
MKRLAVLLSVLAVLVCAPLANATVTINYQIGAGLVLLCDSGVNSASCNITGPGSLTLNLVGSSANSPGTVTEAHQFNSTNHIGYAGATPVTLKIWFTADGFVMPSGAGVLYTSELSGTSVAGNTGTQTLGATSCIDTSDGVAPPLGCAGGTLTHANQTYFHAHSDDETLMTTVGPLGTPYALQQLITLSLNKTANLNFSSSQSLTAVPEPGSIVLLGSLVAGLATFIRRKAASRA